MSQRFADEIRERLVADLGELDRAERAYVEGIGPEPEESLDEEGSAAITIPWHQLRSGALRAARSIRLPQMRTFTYPVLSGLRVKFLFYDPRETLRQLRLAADEG